MNIWQMFGWRRKRAMTIADMLKGPSAASVTVENDAPLVMGLLLHAREEFRSHGVSVERKLEPVTPLRVGPSPVVGDAFPKAETKCAWCNVPSVRQLPQGCIPFEYRCAECGERNHLLATGISQIVPRDTVARQISRGEVTP